MIYAPANASDEQLVQIVHGWMDLVSRGDYSTAYNLYSYRMAPNRAEISGAACIRADIECYRSSALFPDQNSFHVTDWRVAQGTAPAPRITWYKPIVGRHTRTFGYVGMLRPIESHRVISAIESSSERRR